MKLEIDHPEIVKVFEDYVDSTLELNEFTYSSMEVWVAGKPVSLDDVTILLKLKRIT